MMPSTVIDLSRLPTPQVVEALDYEQILAALKGDLRERAPELGEALDLESEPLVKLLEVCAYREVLLRQRVNDAARSTMLAYAAGSNLDQIAALFGVKRLVVQEADADAVPPLEAVYEDDEALRGRVQLAPESTSVAGPANAYRAVAKAVSGRIKDVSVYSPKPGEVRITALTHDNGGVADLELVRQVMLACSADDVRPLTDLVIAQNATVKNYAVEAQLWLYPGPGDAEVLTEAKQRLQAYVDDHFALGHDITLSGLYAALHVSGVQRVEITAPSEDIACANHEAADCGGIRVVIGGRDE